MKISNASFINQTYTAAQQSSAQQAQQQAAQQKSTAQDSGMPATDSINLSSTTKDLQKISAASETMPSDRQQRVQDLKQMVQANQYTVNADQVAEKMIGSIMNEIG